ncbi:hypothetical protein FSP39_001103 [Pinctada imbricata]|uniref:Transposase n=1 Tax=Pinctada imbricata TaxID=66713 RepID=A0AA88YMR5_PINIB|nr:hypothetical protein FSP39_001103 [Pinctada imbricata]
MAGDAHNVSRALVYKWHKRFREGREAIQDDERSGRPREIDDNVTQSIRDAITGDGRVTILDIAEIVD